MHYLQESNKQHRFDEKTLTVAHARNDMNQFVNWENKRSNVDGSKKRAVLQGMDYDGFRQMVLGAHLVPMKKDAVMNIVTPGDYTMNFKAAYDIKNNFQEGHGYDEELVR